MNAQGTIRPGLVFAALLVMGASSAFTSPEAEPRRSLVVHVPYGPTPVVVDGASRLVYELHLTNFTRDPVRLQRVEVRSVDGDGLLADLGEEELLRRTAAPSGAPGEGDPLAILPGALAVVYLEVVLGPDRGVPDALAHRVEFTRSGADEAEGALGAPVRIANAEPVVLGPPLTGGPWASIYHPSWARGHRRVYYVVDGTARIPGRFAIDFFRVDEAGRVASGDRDVVASWFGFGAEVLAVADAVVAAARDDVAESSRISTHTRLPLEDGTGNYVALDLGDGRFAFYEHLKAGSIRVSPGQRVRRGDVIAAVGFSGHTSGPHLHFHVADTNSPLGAEGLPFVLDRFELLGAFGDDAGSLFLEPWSPLDASAARARASERPRPNAVIRFD